MKNIVIDKTNVDCMPVLEIHDKAVIGKKPLVLFIHGFGTCKEYHLYEAYRLAEEGYHAVAFDVYGHGEMVSGELKAMGFWEKAHFIPHMIQETVKYIDRVIDSLLKKDSVDTSRTALVGFSLGGCVVYEYLCSSPRPEIKTAIPICSTPKLKNMFTMYLEQSPFKDKQLLEKGIGILEDSACHKHLMIRELPLLMINVKEDSSISIEDVRQSYRLLKDSYTNKQLISLIEYKGVGHMVTPDMFDRAIDWLNGYI